MKTPTPLIRTARSGLTMTRTGLWMTMEVKVVETRTQTLNMKTPTVVKGSPVEAVKAAVTIGVLEAALPKSILVTLAITRDGHMQTIFRTPKSLFHVNVHLEDLLHGDPA